MENAAEALKIAGFTLLFVTALSVAMTTVMQGKNASETIISYSDKTKYYSNIEVTNNSEKGNRIVSVYDIIPTLYRYKQEEYVVLFYNNNVTPLQIFNGDSKISEVDLTKKISYLNYNLEDKMQENWRQNDSTVKGHVDDVVEYLLNNHENGKFIETISTTTNKYTNNAGLSYDSTENTNSLENDIDTIRVITYTLKP